MERRKPIVKFILVAAAMLIVLNSLDWIQSRFLSNGSSISLSAEAAQIPTLDGARLSALLTQNNKPSLLFIYASWCPHCRRQKPIMEQMLTEYGHLFNVYAISTDKNPNALATYLQNSPTNLATYRVDAQDFLDFRIELAQTGSKFVGAIPYNVFISPDKKLLAEMPGFVDKATILNAYQVTAARR